MTAQSEIGPFASAAAAFARLVREIPETAWDGPGLGGWDLRSLVGHTSIALSSVGAYLKAPAEREDVASAADYYALVHKFASSAEATTGNEEAGRRAATELGLDPAGAVESLVEHALSDLAGEEDQLIKVAGGVGIRLSSYVPTRTFELAVHSLDIARAACVPFTLPGDALSDVTALAAQVAVLNGQGEEVLMSLTGRAPLPPSFSIL